MNVQILKFSQPYKKQRGSTVLWALLGLLGFAALTWFCVARHVPLLEQRLQTSVLGAIEPLNAGNINVEMSGYTANLSGAVQNSTVRDDLIAAATGVAGVRTVNNNLQLVASPVTANVDTNDTADTQIIEPAAKEPEAPSQTPEAKTPVETVTASTDAPAPSPAPAPEPAPEPTPEPAPEPAPESAPQPSPEPAPVVTTEAVTETTESTPRAAGDAAELNIAVADRTVTLTGRVQDQRELRPIVEIVMTTFDLNYVSNKTSAADTIGAVKWVDGLVTSIPELTSIDNPSIDIFDQQITIGGSVKSEADQQSVIDSIQKNLPDLSLVNRLRVDESSSTTSEPVVAENVVAAADSVALQAARQAADAKRQADIEEQFREEARKLEEAQRATADAERAKVEVEQVEAKSAALIAEATEAEAAAKAAEAERIKAEAAAEEEDPVLVAANNLSTAFNELPDTRVLFQSGSDVITRDSQDRLDEIAKLLLEYPIVPVDVKGHTDSQGDDAANLALSQLRANAVRDYLVDKGVSVFRLSSFGYGEGLPITTNDTPDGRAANRRIEFSF